MKGGNGNIRFVLIVSTIAVAAWWVQDRIVSHIDTKVAEVQDDPARVWAMQKIREAGAKRCKTL